MGKHSLTRCVSDKEYMGKMWDMTEQDHYQHNQLITSEQQEQRDEYLHSPADA